MTAEEIVKRLRLQVEYICTYNESGMVGREVSSNVLCNAAADLIERQAKVIDAVEGIIEKIGERRGRILTHATHWMIAWMLSAS
jgi:hypothetical protein